MCVLVCVHVCVPVCVCVCHGYSQNFEIEESCKCSFRDESQVVPCKTSVTVREGGKGEKERTMNDALVFLSCGANKN